MDHTIDANRSARSCLRAPERARWCTTCVVRLLIETILAIKLVPLVSACSPLSSVPTYEIAAGRFERTSPSSIISKIPRKREAADHASPTRHARVGPKREGLNHRARRVEDREGGEKIDQNKSHLPNDAEGPVADGSVLDGILGRRWRRGRGCRGVIISGGRRLGRGSGGSGRREDRLTRMGPGRGAAATGGAGRPRPAALHQRYRHAHGHPRVPAGPDHCHQNRPARSSRDGGAPPRPPDSTASHRYYVSSRARCVAWSPGGPRFPRNDRRSERSIDDGSIDLDTRLESSGDSRDGHAATPHSTAGSPLLRLLPSLSTLRSTRE